jgi:hypothetical protein
LFVQCFLYWNLNVMITTVETITAIDNKLSKRFLELDPAGYFIIYLDREAGLICTKHFTNEVNEQGLAVDPETGKPIRYNC